MRNANSDGPIDDPNDPRQALLDGLTDDPTIDRSGVRTPAGDGIPNPVTTGGNTTQAGPGTTTTPSVPPTNPTTAPSPNPYANGGKTPNNVPPGTIIPGPNSPGATPLPGGGYSLPTVPPGLPHGTPPPGWTPQYAPGTDPAKMDFGNLADPTKWMSLVGNDTQLNSWIKSVLPNASPADVTMWANYIKKSPGANATEQAGGAEYWKKRMLAPDGGPEAAPTAPAPTDPAQSAFSQQLRDTLLSQIQGLQTPETAESGDIAPAIQAHNNQSVRDQQRERDQLAETAYAKSAGGNPLDSGDFNVAAQQAAEAAGNNRANFTGTTVANANTARRTALLSSLGAALQEQGLGQQDQQYHDYLAELYASLLAGMNDRTVNAGLGG